MGKVRAITLVRDHGDTVADVTFSLDKDYRLTTNTALAVKYQNLTGIRYIDMQVPHDPGAPTDHLSATMTTPSFDITQLFNGLEPVLATVSPEQVNTFTDNAASLLQGDGGGLAPLLDSIQAVAKYAHNRQEVISTLVNNLARISQTLGGRSSRSIEFLRDMSVPVADALSVLDQFQKTATYGPEFMAPVDRLLIELGLSPDADIDKLLASAFSSPTEAAKAFRLLPSAVEWLQQAQSASAGVAQRTCAHGVVALPTDVKVLLGGSEVVICNAQ